MAASSLMYIDVYLQLTAKKFVSGTKWSWKTGMPEMFRFGKLDRIGVSASKARPGVTKPCSIPTKLAFVTAKSPGAIAT